MSELKAVAALTQILGIVQNYLPPDSGMTADDVLGQIIAVVDPWPLDGEPQLPVIPVGWEWSWRWMRHPTWNYGEPIPVQVWREASTGVVYYRPFDCRAQDFEWDLRSSDWKEIVPAPQSPAVDGATLAGLVSAVGHLSALVDQMRALLVEVEDVCGHDDRGFEFEDGESEIIDKVRAMIAATNAPQPPAVEPLSPLEQLPDGHLYGAINNLLCHCAMEGSIDADHGFVHETMAALKKIDGGVYLPDLAVTPAGQPLAEAEIKSLYGESNFDVTGPYVIAFARAIEAAHGTTNHETGCGACGDGCKSRGSCRLADESPEQQAKATEGGAL